MTNDTHPEDLRHAIAARREGGRLFLLVADLVHGEEGDHFANESWIEAAHDEVAVTSATRDHCHVHVRGERFHGGPGCEHAVISYRHRDKPGATDASVLAGLAAHFAARGKGR